ncbi:hypothetical protein CBI38_34265 (plasmid) [Rhodococcus oxybenzonivorans]|uniref:Uncharacterized protein n=1 Tax=Rhodococcus oxybenzonivorans TaxID=1990687 RepID=A0A2S2C6H1_9NOCA|nr:hypothetical protein [Rhodococcus oxybenzonivorans]AWK76459.1 hypothetical protein CBI38_34265 [Rhodococcus oxybenzonivorans]
MAWTVRPNTAGMPVPWGVGIELPTSSVTQLDAAFAARLEKMRDSPVNQDRYVVLRSVHGRVEADLVEWFDRREQAMQAAHRRHQAFMPRCDPGGLGVGEEIEIPSGSAAS